MVSLVTPAQRARERSIELALYMDFGMITMFTIATLVTGSLTMLAELIRGVLMTLIEVFALLVMKRIHRGRITILEFGSGKLEQLMNLLIAGGLLLGGVWIGVDVVRKLIEQAEPGSPASFAFAAVSLAVNVFVNTLAWDGMRRATREGSSVIMTSQLQAREVKLIASVVVLVLLTIAALSIDAVIMLWLDAVGATFVSIFIVRSAFGMLSEGVPDLIDRSVNEEFQAAINRTLVKHFDDYDRLEQVRTRRAGEVVHAEISLGFRPDLTMAEVNARIAAIKDSLRQDIGDADIAILAS